MGKRLGLPMLIGFGCTEIILMLIQFCMLMAGKSVVAPAFAARFPSETAAVLAQLLLVGMIGVAFAGGAQIFEIERWSFLKQGVVHFLITTAVWLPISIFIWAIYKYPAAIISTAPLTVADGTDGASWMAGIEDSTPINELSIPGSHDTGATHSIADVAGIFQTLGIYDQLNIGIRFLDIRLQLVNDKLRVVHSFVDQALNFDTVLGDITDFILNNPSEFLIISIILKYFMNRMCPFITMSTMYFLPIKRNKWPIIF